MVLLWYSYGTPVYSHVTEQSVYSEFHHSKYTTYLTTCFTMKCGGSRSGEVHLKIWWISIIDLVNFNSRFVQFMVFSWAVLTVNINTSCRDIYSEFYNTNHYKFNTNFTIFMKKTE